MTFDELQKVEARYQRAFRRSEAEREQRNAAVRAAVQTGWTHARIAEATGLTRARVGQIANRNDSTSYKEAAMTWIVRYPMDGDDEGVMVGPFGSGDIADAYLAEHPHAHDVAPEAEEDQWAGYVVELRSPGRWVHQETSNS